MLQLDDPTFDPIARRYHAEMLALALDAMNGRLSQSAHRRQQTALAENVTQAVILLAGSRITHPFIAEFWQRQQRIIAASAWSLARAVANGRLKTQTAISKRLTLWTHTLGGAWHRSLIAAPSTGDLQWQRGRTEKPCPTCLLYDGQSHPSKFWHQLAIRKKIYPQGPGLDCGGWHCDCRLKPTGRRPAPAS